MAVIWKYPLDLGSHPSRNVIHDLIQPTALYVGHDYRGDPCVWVLHHADDWDQYRGDTPRPEPVKMFVTGYWTGWNMDVVGRYLGSFQDVDLMWHFWVLV